MKRYLFLILSLTATQLFPQNWQWAKDCGFSYGTGVQVDAVGNIYELASGGPQFQNYSLSCAGNGVIAKMDNAGNVIWARGLGALSYASAFSLDKGANIYVTGYFRESAVFCGGNNPNYTVTAQDNNKPDAFICKYDNNGDLMWVHTWGELNVDDQGKAIKTDMAGNSYVGGFQVKQANGSYLTNFSLRKIDPQGIAQWVNTSDWRGSACPTDIDMDESVDADHFYITGGFRDSAFFGNTTLLTNTFSTIFLAKYDLNGNLSWAKKDGTGYDIAYSITLSKKGDLYLTGEHSNPSTFGTTTFNTGKLLVAKYDLNGNNWWAKTATAATGMGVSADTAGNCFITGAFRSPAVFGLQTLNSQKGTDMFVAKFESNGNFNWAIAPTGPTGDVNAGSGIICDLNNNIFVTGNFNSTSVFGGTSLAGNNGLTPHIFLAKLKDTLQNIITQTNDLEEGSGDLFIFPNPAGNFVSVSADHQELTDPLVIKIYNALGEEIYYNCFRNASQNFSTTIPLDNCIKGIYFIDISCGRSRTVRRIIHD